MFKKTKALEATPPDYGDPPYEDLEHLEEVIRWARAPRTMKIERPAGLERWIDRNGT